MKLYLLIKGLFQCVIAAYSEDDALELCSEVGCTVKYIGIAEYRIYRGVITSTKECRTPRERKIG